MISRIITLGEFMKQFQTLLFNNIGYIHTVAEIAQTKAQWAVSIGQRVPVFKDEDDRKSFNNIMVEIERDCKKYGLEYTAKSAARCMVNDVLEAHTLLSQVHDLLARFMDETESRMFFLLPSDKQYLYTSYELFGSDVAKAFSKTIMDVEEAGKCLAFERWTAAVFHLLIGS